MVIRYKSFALTGRKSHLSAYPGRCPGLTDCCPFRALFTCCKIKAKLELNKEKQWACKPGSVPAEAGACHLSRTPLPRRLHRSTLRLGRAALSHPCALVRTQSAHRRFTRTFNLRCAQHVCRHTPGGLLPHLLTLTASVCKTRYLL